MKAQGCMLFFLHRSALFYEDDPENGKDDADDSLDGNVLTQYKDAKDCSNKRVGGGYGHNL